MTCFSKIMMSGLLVATVWWQGAATGAEAATQTEIKSAPLQSIGFFPISPYICPTDPSRFTLEKRVELYQLIAKGGCNMVFAAKNMLDTCQAAGLKVLVTDPRVTRSDFKTLKPEVADAEVAALVKEVNEHPAVAGYWLIDEPGKNSFAGIAMVRQALAKYAPGKLVLVNLFPNVAGPETQLEAKDYNDYLRAYVATCQPQILCYDHYDLVEDRSAPRDTYWQNLQSFRDLSTETGIPFEACVQNGAFAMLREQTPADLNFVVFTPLAYGAKGIMYFPYLSAQVDNYRAEAIDGFGEPHPVTFYHTRNINLQLQRLGKELLRLRSDGVYHHSSKAIPAEAKPLSASKLLKGLKIRDPEYHILVGEFTNADDQGRYLMLVNCDLQRSAQVTPELAVPPKALHYFETQLGYYIDFTGRNWLAPGAGRLLKIIEK